MLRFSKEESYEIVRNGILSPPITQSGLYEFVTALTGEYIPFEPVCKDHCPPWDYIWHSYRVDLPKWEKKSNRNIVYIGPRAGYKTLSVAKLIAAELLQIGRA